MTERIDEDDARIVAQFVEIDRDGEPMRAYYAAPRHLQSETPCVVLAMHLFGIDANQRETARRFASCGFAAVVPDLYARFDAPDGDGSSDHHAFLPFARGLSAETVDPDIAAAACWLRARVPGTKMAIAGFCMGGVVAMRRSVGYAGTFDAVAAWYGLSPDVDPANVDIPIVASYGADDAGIPVARVEAFRSGLRVRNDVKIYPRAGHAFCDSTRAAYEPVAAEDSWQRTLAFLRINLSS